MVEHDDVDPVGAESAFGGREEVESKPLAPRRIEIGDDPDGDVDVGEGMDVAAGLRADQGNGDDAVAIEGGGEAAPRGDIDRRERGGVRDCHQVIVPARRGVKGTAERENGSVVLVRLGGAAGGDPRFEVVDPG